MGGWQDTSETGYSWSRAKASKYHYPDSIAPEFDHTKNNSDGHYLWAAANFAGKIRFLYLCIKGFKMIILLIEIFCQFNEQTFLILVLFLFLIYIIICITEPPASIASLLSPHVGFTGGLCRLEFWYYKMMIEPSFRVIVITVETNNIVAFDEIIGSDNKQWHKRSVFIGEYKERIMVRKLVLNYPRVWKA